MLARGVMIVALSGCSLAFTNAPSGARICTTSYAPVVVDASTALAAAAVGGIVTYGALAVDSTRTAALVAVPAVLGVAAFTVAAIVGRRNVEACRARQE